MHPLAFLSSAFIHTRHTRSFTNAHALQPPTIHLPVVPPPPLQPPTPSPPLTHHHPQDAEEEYDLGAMTDPVQDPSVAAAHAESSTPTTISLDQCLEAFTTPEQLDAADSWYCGKCKEHVRADKKLDLWTLPEVLVVHLKRFSYSRMWRDKLDAAVDFPLEGLDLSRFVLQHQVERFGGLGSCFFLWGRMVVVVAAMVVC